MEIGAREIKRAAHSNEPLKSQDVSIFMGLFDNHFGDCDLIELLVDMREKGFPEYPEGSSLADHMLTAAQSIDNLPTPKDVKDSDRSRAWVLAWLSWHNYLWEKAIAENNPHDARNAGIAMGRLVEWWVWRRDGHDRRATGKARSERNLPKARQQRKINQEWDAGVAWHDEARQEAQTLKAKNQKRSRWNIAGELAKKYGKSQKQVSKVIRPALT